MAVAEELIKIRVAVEGAAGGTAELENLDRAVTRVGASSSKTAASVKTLGAAAKSVSPAAASATASTTSLGAALLGTGNGAKIAQVGLSQTAAAAGPLTSALAGSTSASTALAVAGRALGATMTAALGPIGLLVGALVMIGSALIDAGKKSDEARRKSAEWAREYGQHAREVMAARAEVVRAHENQIKIGTAEEQIATLEHELEMLTLLGASTAAIAEKQIEIAEAKQSSLAVSRQLQRTDKGLAKLDLERATSALSRLESEKNRAAAISDSTSRTEALRNVEEQILEANRAVTEAISAQNSARERGFELAKAQVDLDRQQQLEEAKGKRAEIEVFKGETVAAFTGAKDTSAEVMQVVRGIVIDAGGSESDADEVIGKILEGSEKKRRSGGRKPKKEEKVEARFGDYRDVLKTYADSRAGVDSKALDSLAKGMMPKDHKPETSITVTNNSTYSFESQIVIDGKDKAGRAVAQDIAAFFQAEIEKATRQTPNGLVR